MSAQTRVIHYYVCLGAAGGKECEVTMKPTIKAKQLFEEKSSKNAIILAAGFGMRMVPINTQTPKALIEVDGEPLIEWLIRQLHLVGINEIYIVVFFKRTF
jgi:hypothetical protein